MQEPHNSPEPNEHMLDAERDVQARLGDQELNFDANRAISNIYRAAAAARRQAEGGVLREFNLSWGGFTILWVLWVWGEMETAQLANECNLAKGTLTGMVTTLEKRDLVVRTRSPEDKRRVLVSATSAGIDVIAELFPRFNTFEAELVHGLTPGEQRELARLLRIVIQNSAPASAE